MTWLRWRSPGVGAVVLGLLALAAPGLVEARKDDKSAANEKEAAPIVVADLGTAFQLAEYGRASDAPESLIMAAGLLRVLGRAELKELDAKVEVESTDMEKAKEPKALAKPDLETDAKDLIVEAEAMSAKMPAKQRAKLSMMIGMVRDRKFPAGSAGVVQYLGRTLKGGQTHLLHLKVTADEGTDLAIRANSPVLASVIRENNKSVLAATLTAGGNLHFEPNVSEGTVARGVKGVSVKLKHPKHPHPHHHHRDPHKRRGVTPDGDCPITIRITNPTDQPIECTLFAN